MKVVLIYNCLHQHLQSKNRKPRSGLPDPAFLFANMPVAPVETRVTASEPKIPIRDAFCVLRVAAVVPSYTLLLAFTPETVNVAGVILQ